jgi:cyclic pyranopterin phosphate synthase
MVNVGAKDVTVRKATARARVQMSHDTFLKVVAGDTPKGDVLATVRIAAIQAAKLTPNLLPLCHQVQLTKVEIAIELIADMAIIDATAEARDRTGVEMEAMVAASTAALTLYDMLKAVDRGMSFDVALVEKAGGRSGHWQRPEGGETTETP